MSDAKFYAIVTYLAVAGAVYGAMASTLYFVFDIGSVLLWGVLLAVQTPLHAYVCLKIQEIPEAKRQEHPMSDEQFYVWLVFHCGLGVVVGLSFLLFGQLA